MTYYVVNANRTHRTLSRGQAESLIDAFRPVVRAQQGPLPGSWSSYQAELTYTEATGGALFIVSRAGEPILVAAVAWDAAAEPEAWQCVESLYLSWTDWEPVPSDILPEKPDSLPWVAVLLLPDYVSQPADFVEYVHVFCQLFAFAILDEASRSSSWYL